MIMTICSKFGTSGTGVAVGVGDGVRVAVGGTGVKVDVGEGLGDGVTVGAGICVQATNKTRGRITKIERFTKPP